MTKEEIQLLLKDLCARLPYGVIIAYKSRESEGHISLGYGNIGYVAELGRGWWEDCKPYLRPMSSMTEEERKEYNDIVKNTIDFYNCPKSEEICFFITPIDWLNAHHFDYRGLIEKNLAIEAPKDMYNLKEK